MNRTYFVMDALGRCWGSFDASERVLGELNGFLRPLAAFDEVRGIFLDHMAAMASVDGNSDQTGARIVRLGAYLVDSSSRERIDIGNIIFVNDDLLVSCCPDYGKGRL